MKVSVINKQDLRHDQEEVLQKFMAFQEAMIEKDLEKLNDLICDNYTLRHMSGRTQTKQEFIDVQTKLYFCLKKKKKLIH